MRSGSRCCSCCALAPTSSAIIVVTTTIIIIIVVVIILLNRVFLAPRLYKFKEDQKDKCDNNAKEECDQSLNFVAIGKKTERMRNDTGEAVRHGAREGDDATYILQ